jgi:hypothetical protein
MSDPSVEQDRLPLIYASGRSAVDSTRLRWSGAGNAILATYFLFGSKSGAFGIVVGILIIALGLAVWVITRFGTRQWYSISPVARGIAATGSVIGVAIMYITFGIFFLIIWIISLFA